jgi:hypothetical protein
MASNVGARAATFAPALKKAFPIRVVFVVAVVLIALGVTSCNGKEENAGAVVVPDVVGKTAADATSQLEGLKLKVQVAETKTTGTVGPGQVAAQKPGGGQKVAEGTTIELVVEAPTPPPIRIPAANTSGSRPPPIKIPNPSSSPTVEPTPGKRPSPIIIKPPPRPSPIKIPG